MPTRAYFCMEFGLSSDFPIYSGGLGILAGDFIKSVDDENAPIVGIGLFWNQGYTQQLIHEGKPIDQYPSTTRKYLSKLDAQFSVTIEGKDVPCQAHRVDMNGVGELLLIEPKNEADQALTARLYGGDAEARIRQEILLGIGGVRLLRALGYAPEIYHLNEGHALFAAHEMICEQMAEGASFDEARKRVRDAVVFTTHTPVAAGNEKHPLELLHRLGGGAGLTPEQLRDIGGDPFCMTTAALRLSRLANAVAKMHQETAKEMWAETSDAADIVCITNGVHRGTWQASDIAKAAAADKPDSLWKAHQKHKHALIDYIKKHNGVTLDVDKPIIGFARRAAPYKRGDMLFRDSHRLEAMCREHGVQFVFSGKAHPRDEAGKQIISNIVEAAMRWPENIVFIENYQMEIGALLTRGCDVWLNTPRPPKEACGTSGMKAAMNGVLNASVLDGWWPEMCTHGVNGWRIPAAAATLDDDARDKQDAKALYSVLEDYVLPTYQDPKRWRAMMIKSVNAASEQFSSARMLRDYESTLYSR